MRFPVVVSLSCFLALTVFGAAPAIGAPTIEFTKAEFDIGKPFEGEIVKIRYDFRNTGDTDLEITKVQAGCGCTAAAATHTKLKPGQSSSIDGTFNTTGYRGQIRKSIDVGTNDPDHRLVVLAITGQVMPLADLQPQYSLILGGVKPGEVREGKFTVVPKAEPKFEITKAESNGKLVTVTKFDKKGNSEGNYVVEFKVQAPKTAGRFYEQISVVTSLPGNPAVRFPVYGNVDADQQKPGSLAAPAPATNQAQ